MTSLTTVTTAPVTKSSREIAELTGKRHPDVKRDIITTLEALGKDASSFAHIYLDSMNRDKAKKFLESGAPATTSPSWATAKFSK